MVECFDERLCKARCCALDLADDYVTAALKGRNTEQMFNTLMLVSAYMNALERYEPRPQVSYAQYEFYCRLHQKEVTISDDGCPVFIDPDMYNCLSSADVEKIFEQISILCGGCSCNCN